jgi:hypothetical protein
MINTSEIAVLVNRHAGPILRCCGKRKLCTFRIFCCCIEDCSPPSKLGHIEPAKRTNTAKVARVKIACPIAGIRHAGGGRAGRKAANEVESSRA